MGGLVLEAASSQVDNPEFNILVSLEVNILASQEVNTLVNLEVNIQVNLEDNTLVSPEVNTLEVSILELSPVVSQEYPGYRTLPQHLQHLL